MPLSNQVDWAPTESNLAAALASLAGADLTAGNKIRDKVHAAGTSYDARFDVTVNTAKGFFLVAAQTAHNAADHAARFGESLVGPVAPALTFDAYSNTAILARLQKAAAGQVPQAVKDVLGAHGNTVQGAYSRSTATAAYFDALTQVVSPPFILPDILNQAVDARAHGDTQRLASLAAQAIVLVGQLVEAVDARAQGGQLTPRIVTLSPGVRTMELDLLSGLADANAFLALTAY